MIDFEKYRQNIIDKKHFWVNIDVGNYDWNKIMSLIDSHPPKLYDWNREKQRVGLNSFHMRPSAPQFAKDTHEEMVKYFSDRAPKKDKYEKGAPQITNIAFVGFGQNSNSYPRHKDSMDVFLLQVINECKITIGYTETPSDADEVRIMRPGEAVWLPRGTWHQLEPTVSRVSFSFGFESDMDTDPALWL